MHASNEATVYVPFPFVTVHSLNRNRCLIYGFSFSSSFSSPPVGNENKTSKTESYNYIEISRDLTISVQAKLVRLDGHKSDLKLSQHFY